MAKENKKKQKSSPVKWVLTAFILTFVLSLIFSFISNIAINGLDIIPAILVLILVLANDYFQLLFDKN